MTAFWQNDLGPHLHRLLEVSNLATRSFVSSFPSSGDVKACKVRPCDWTVTDAQGIDTATHEFSNFVVFSPTYTEGHFLPPGAACWFSGWPSNQRQACTTTFFLRSFETLSTEKVFGKLCKFQFQSTHFRKSQWYMWTSAVFATNPEPDKCCVLFDEKSPCLKLRRGKFSDTMHWQIRSVASFELDAGVLCGPQKFREKQRRFLKTKVSHLSMFSCVHFTKRIKVVHVSLTSF